MSNPAFLLPPMTMTSPPPASNPSVSPHLSASSCATPKRVRVSELSQKYRPILPLDDENVLICDNSPASESVSPNVRFSRFPDSWSETQNQVLAAVAVAVTEGHDRIRVDVKNPHLIPPRQAVPDSIASVTSSNCLPRLVDTACSIVDKLLRMDQVHIINYEFQRKLQTAVLHFDTAEDARLGKLMIPESLTPFVRVHTLGDPVVEEADIHVVIAPCNRGGNPARIEDVQAVHYSGWTKTRVIVMLNPDLVALTKAMAFDGETREPGFLSDYVSSYYIDPAAYPTKTVMGAVLKCFPRKWELYLMKLRGDVGFRLVSEQQKLPSAEKLRCLFSWRAEEVGSAFLA